jgi:hypothetical protein
MTTAAFAGPGVAAAAPWAAVSLLLGACHGGLVVHVDYARLAEARRPPAK